MSARIAVRARAGSNSYDAWRRAARYVARILDGAKPGKLPVEQLDRYKLVINNKRARALVLTIPRSLQIRADRTIE